MAIQSFATFHKQVPTAQYSPVYGFHAPCDTQLVQMTDGDAVLAFCPTCKLPDTQALGALIAAIAWLHDNEKREITGDTALREYEESGPGKKPPVPFKYVRLWSFEYGVDLDEAEDGESDGDDEGISDLGERDFIVGLTPDGEYDFDLAEYQQCGQVGIDRGCTNFLSVTARGVLACPEHGELKEGQ